MKKFLVLAALVGAQAAGLATAGELNVQGSSATGGDALVIRGRIGGAVNFSVTGAFNDVATVFPRPGSGLQAPRPLTIRDLANGTAAQLGPLVRISATQLPDGQTRVLLSIPTAIQQFNGGKVELRRNGALIDGDPIQLR